MTTSRTSPSWRAFAVWIAVALALRAIHAFESSFWLDELHSLDHGLRATLNGVSDSVQRDFHAPLFYYAVQRLGLLFGGDLDVRWLRVLPVLGGVIAFVPIVALAKEAGLTARGRLVAVAFAATLPFQIHYSAEFRPYSWLMAASATLAYGAFAVGGSAWFRVVLVFAATAIGTHLSHFLMALVVLAVGAARVAAIPAYFAARRRDASAPRPLPIWALVAAAGAGGATFLPWAVLRMPWLFAEPGELAPEGPRIPMTSGLWQEVAEQALKICLPRISSLGKPWSEMAVLGATVFCLAAAAALLAGIRQFFATRGARTPGASAPRIPAAAWAVAAFFCILFVVLSYVQIVMWRRFALRYAVTFAWAAPLACGALFGAIEGRIGRLVRGFALAAVLMTGVAESLGGSREAIDKSVAVAIKTGARLSDANPEAPPLYTSLLWQPEFFNTTLPLRAYAGGAAIRSPELLPRVGDPDFARPVVVVTQRIKLPELAEADNEDWRVGGIRTGRRLALQWHVDHRISVYVYLPEVR